MTHTDIIKDADAFFEINPITRVITNKTPDKTKVMQYDHNSERFTFSMPQFVEGHDMLNCSKVEVHYININTNTKEETRGLYEVKDVQMHPEESERIIFSWLLSQNVTRDAGVVNFIIRFSCVADDGVIEYAWSSERFKAISVCEGIYNTDVIVELYADVLEQWKTELFDASAVGVQNINTATATAMAKLEAVAREVEDSIPDDYSRVSKDVNELKSDLSIVQSANRFSRSLCNVGFCKLDGTIAANAGYSYMYLDVNPGDTLYFYFLNHYNSDMTETGETVPRELSMRFLCAFDSDGNAVSESGAENVKTYTVPEGITKIAISMQSSVSNQYGRNIDYVMVLINDPTYPNSFKPYKADFYVPKGEDYFKETVIQMNPMYGKVGVCFGDSITEGIGALYSPLLKIEVGTRYPDMIAKITKATIFNVGFGGTRMSNTGDCSLASFPAVADAIVSRDFSNIQSYVNSATTETHIARVTKHLEILQSIDFSKVDFITLAYGTNDWAGGVPVDNAENPLDTSTILGGIRYGIDKILTAYPHLKVFAFSPIYRNDIGGADDDSDTYLYNGKTLKDISDSICECFNSLHIPCKNSYDECNLNKYNMSIYSEGGVHLNDEGYKRLGEQYAEFVLSKY